tara:strand:- start:2371 stop:3438 length:1068 start_codon:yes stop_codon:yes gene_type:complete
MTKTLINDVIKIGNHKIGSNYPTFIIAEIGVNHNGQLSIAKELIKKAKFSGADCVKFQTFKAERIATKETPKASYQLDSTDPNESQLDMLRSLELPKSYYTEIIKCCEDNDITFLSTPYSEEDVDFLDDLNVKAYKLASISSAEPDFAKYVANKQKPLILSTGMSNMDELRETLKEIKSTENSDIVLLQCTTNYPSRHEDSNLLCIKSLRNEFEYQVGYSDHTTDDIACIMSIAMGATVIEKHLTLDRNLQGPDHSSSYEPNLFKQLVNNIRNAEKSMGSGIKEPSTIEIQNSKQMRRSIVAKTHINAGIKIDKSMLALKRPANGISPLLMSKVLKKTSRVNIKKDQVINWIDLK